MHEGEYADDKRNGKGVMMYADGRRMEGIWIRGKMVKVAAAAAISRKNGHNEHGDTINKFYKIKPI